MSSIKQRKKARKLAMQALYQWQLSQHSADELLLQFQDEFNSNNMDAEYFSEAIRGVLGNSQQIDKILLQYIDRGLDELHLVELAILRLAFYELIFRLDIPYRVVIDEAIQLAKRFGSIEGYKYINGVLDSAVVDLRKLEKG